MNWTQSISPKVRSALYIAYGVIGFGIGVTQTILASTGQGDVTWFATVLSVYAYVGVAFGFTAAGNTATSPVVGGDADQALDVDEPAVNDVEVDDDDLADPEDLVADEGSSAAKHVAA